MLKSIRTTVARDNTNKIELVTIDQSKLCDSSLRTAILDYQNKISIY